MAALAAVPADSAAQVPDTARDTVRAIPHPELVVRVYRTPVAAELLPYSVTVRRPREGVPTAALTLAIQLFAVPGLQVQSRYNDALGDRIVMRGFGARAQFGVRGIQVLVDGVPATMPDGQATLNHLDRALLTRAEVLRGPAAAAHGNAAGGVLLLSTRPPPPVPFRQELGAVAGEGGLVRLRATSGGSGGDLGWVASIAREEREGHRPHSGTERYHLTGRLDGALGGGFLRAILHAVSYDARNPGSLTPEQFRTDPYQAQAYNVAQGTGEEGRHGQVGLVWERPLATARLEATLYGLARTVENPIPPTVIDLDRRAGGARLLFRSDRPAGADPRRPLWSVGLDAAVQADDRRNFENVGGERGALTLDQDERVRNLAAHGQLVVPVLRSVDLLLAARYDHVAFSAEDHFTAGGDPDDSGQRTMSAISPTAGVRVALSGNASLFGNISTAFETPTTTELVNRPDGAGGFNRDLDPQRTASYEVGGRARVAEAVRLEASVYHADVQDALVPFEVETAPGRQYFRNAGGAVHRGLELLGELGTERIDVLAAYSRTLAEFGDYATGGGESLEGREVPGIRPWTVEVRVAARPGAGLVLEADYQATGDMAVDDLNTSEARAPGYQLVGLRAGAPGLVLGSVEAAPYVGVTNLLDESYVASVVPNAFGSRFFEPGPGRAFYVGVEVGMPGVR